MIIACFRKYQRLFYIIQSIVGLHLYHFSHTNQQYVLAFQVAFSKSQFLAHRIFRENTYIFLGGYCLKISFLATHSRNCIRNSIAIFCQSFILHIATTKKSVAFEKGGFVIMSPCHVFIKSL